MKVIGWLPSGGTIDVEVPPVAGTVNGKQDTVPGEHTDKSLGDNPDASEAIKGPDPTSD